MKLQSCSGFATKGLCTSFAPGSQHEIRRFWFNIFGKPGNPASCFWTTMTVFKNMRETAAFGAGWKHKAACMVMASYSNQIFSTQQLHCFVISSLLPMLSLGLIMTAWEETMTAHWEHEYYCWTHTVTRLIQLNPGCGTMHRLYVLSLLWNALHSLIAM